VIYGYARVSTNGQDLAAQVAELQAAGCTKIYREKASGAKTDRPELAKLMRSLDRDDVLVVCRLDRLARSTRDLLNVLATVAERDAGFKSLKDTWADTTTPHGKLMLTVLGGLAEFEREQASERPWRQVRQAAGLNFASKTRSTSTPCQRRSTGRCGAILRCKSGNDLAAGAMKHGERDGHDTRALQHYLGHKNIQHTVRYTELSPDRFRDFWR